MMEAEGEDGDEGVGAKFTDGCRVVRGGQGRGDANGRRQAACCGWWMHEGGDGGGGVRAVEQRPRGRGCHGGEEDRLLEDWTY